MKLEISGEELYRLLNEEILFVDVREEDEERIPGLKCILAPLSRFKEEVGHLPEDKILILFCRGGYRSLKAAEYLHHLRPEQEIYSLQGGYSSISSEFCCGGKPPPAIPKTG